MEDELAKMRNRHASVPPPPPTGVTPMGNDLINGVLPHTMHVGGITYQVTSGITAEDITGLVEWVEEVAEGLQWGVIYLGDSEGPELHDVWGSSAVWVVSGAVRAVLATVTGGPVPAPSVMLLRADAPTGAADMLVMATMVTLDALSRVADFA